MLIVERTCFYVEINMLKSCEKQKIMGDCSLRGLWSHKVLRLGEKKVLQRFLQILIGEKYML